MKQKILNIRNLFFAAIFAVLAVASAMIAVSVSPAYADSAYDFVYAENNANVITGITVNTDKEFIVAIPENVEEIGLGAFKGEKIVGINFAANGKLKKIGDFAFGSISIKNLVLPEGLEEIGNAAFASCADLESVKLPDSLLEVGEGAFGSAVEGLNVTLPNNANATYGEYAFGNNDKVVLLCENTDILDELQSKLSSAVGSSVSATYPVEIRYHMTIDGLDEIIDTETKLFGKSYTYAYTDGKWSESSAIQQVGTVLTGRNNNVFRDPEFKQTYLLVDELTEMLAAEQSIKENNGIDLYVKPADGKPVFIPRNDLVYDGTEYSTSRLNSLLSSVGDRITADMTASITSYKKIGATVSETPVPSSIRDAGVYVIEVKYGDSDNDKTEFTVTVARKQVDLASYDNLFWKLSNGNNLLSSATTDLYLYTNTEGKIFPSQSVLIKADSANNIAGNVKEEYKVDDVEHYTTKQVRYSMVRKQQTGMQVVIAENDAYSIGSYSNNSASGYGAYTASTEITANENYEFVMGAVADADLRGVRINVSADGRTASVAKDWYVIDMPNWITDQSGKDYEIGTRTFGDTKDFPMPKTANADIGSDNNYGTDSDTLVMRLYKDGELVYYYVNVVKGYDEDNKPIIEQEKRTDFKRGASDNYGGYAFKDFLNSSMPVGNYVLEFDVGVCVDDITTPGTIITYEPFTSSVSFTVKPATFSNGLIKNLNDALTGKDFAYLYNAQTHLYDSDADVVSALDKIETKMHEGATHPQGIWLQEHYNTEEYYSESPELSFNLRRWQNNDYSSTGTVDNPLPTAAGDYTVYYTLSAKNYITSIEGNLEEGKTKDDYFFKVLIIEQVRIPTITVKKYNGEMQYADIPVEGVSYRVVRNEGGINAGEYEVELKFNDTYHMWTGDELDNRRDGITLTFKIEQADNGWVDDLSIQNWITGRYDADVNKVVSSAKFGNDTRKVVITDSNGDKVFDSEEGIDKLKNAKPGRYILSVTIDPTENYAGVNGFIFFDIHKKPGLVWWGILLIIIGTLAIVAAVIFILWKKGVFQLLTGKLTLAIRTRATVDATIAAVRASKIAEESKISVANAVAKEKAQKRRAQAEAEKAMSAEEKAAALEAKAKQAAERAERMRARSEAMQARAERLREEAAAQSNPTAESEAAATTDEPKE